MSTRSRRLVAPASALLAAGALAALAGVGGEPSNAGAACTIAGTAAAEHLIGTPGRDVVCGGEGDDTLEGAGGADILLGGAGNDVLYGGAGRDRLSGQEGDDTLLGRDAGRDVVLGGPGDDRVARDRRDAVRSAEWTFPARGRYPVVVAAGDIAHCGSPGDEATSALVAGYGHATVLAIGDTVYENGTLDEYAHCYAPTWGRFRARTRPVPGNHEYHTRGASGYFTYFGSVAGDPRKGYYSFDLGAWHLVGLNSNCAAVGGCHAGSPQEGWLRSDLAAANARCTLAFLHHPLHSSRAPEEPVRPLWQALFDARAEIVLSGHAHLYERHAPLRPDGRLDLTRGLRHFVVGTGGAPLRKYAGSPATVRAASIEAHGVLGLTLKPRGYEWRFVAVAGAAFADRGTGTCF